jgi:hypothetical protein
MCTQGTTQAEMSVWYAIWKYIYHIARVAYEEACTFEVSAQLRKLTALCSTIREKNDTCCWSTFNMVEMVFRFLLISSLFELGQKFGGGRK